MWGHDDCEDNNRDHGTLMNVRGIVGYPENMIESDCKAFDTSSATPLFFLLKYFHKLSEYWSVQLAHISITYHFL